MRGAFDLRHPMFRPLWARVLASAAVLGWAALEASRGAWFWAALFGAAGFWMVWCFFVTFRAEDYE
ncbi:hypothetical protein jaqu_07260 [Jannaschia aquimarina]|uniref:DUF3329 domain-containing protein n=2 Tax=Jannaschia aquimarina TaxID=935700 RepID=A0A0D1CRV1_9RHOB|nr:hypothetical protein jaqu_07260 [Jannaschia aquimarina]SNS73433.1 hypothetical protein SAMN05421775_10283 [Jannaschia aquimarina]